MTLNLSKLLHEIKKVDFYDEDDAYTFRDRMIAQVEKFTAFVEELDETESKTAREIMQRHGVSY